MAPIRVVATNRGITTTRWVAGHCACVGLGSHLVLESDMAPIKVVKPWYHHHPVGGHCMQVHVQVTALHNPSWSVCTCAQLQTLKIQPLPSHLLQGHQLPCAARHAPRPAKLTSHASMCHFTRVFPAGGPTTVRRTASR